LRRTHGLLYGAVCVLLASGAAAQTTSCPGDCDRDGRVTLGELVQVVNIGLGRRALSTCLNLDRDDSGAPTVDEMVLAVEKSMDGCPRMLEGSEALRGTSQLALSNMDHFRVLGFGFVSAGGGGGAGVEETIACDEGSKVVSRRAEAASCTITTAYDDCVEGDVRRDGTLIQTIADATACAVPGPIPTDVNVSLTFEGFTETFTDSFGAEVELFADDLVFARQPMDGGSRTKIDGTLRVRSTTGERFTQLFQNFAVTETPDGEGGFIVTQNGRVSVDCIGDLELRTTQPIRVASAGAACPFGGELEVEEMEGEVQPLRAGLVAERAAGDAALTAQQTAVDTGFDDSLFRAANGVVYQVLQNAGADADEGAESVRITTLVGSTGAASACESSAGSGLDATAIAAAASEPFALASVRKSMIIGDATPPCFNGNAGDGEGSVCIGPACGADCACPSGGACIAFSRRDGMPLSRTTDGVPAAQLVDLRSPDAGPCGGFAYAFGTAAPTTQAPECAPENPQEGFALSVQSSQFAGGTDGSTIVFAYDAPLLSDFRASHAGFSVDLDGKNRVGCTGNNRLLGLGIADTDRTPPPLIGFTGDGGVTFDLDGRDDALNGVVAACRFPALTACVGPTVDTPTPVPSGCPEITLPGLSSVAVSETTTGRDNSVRGASCGDGGNQAPDVTFSYTPPASGFYQIDTTGSSFDTILYVRRATCSGTEVACNDDDGNVSQSKLSIFLEGGEPVVIAVDGFGGASGDVSLQITAAGAPPTATPTRTPATPGLRPDLIATALSAPLAATAGAQINVSATVRNTGLREAGALDVAFVLSTNQVITEDDTVLGLCSFSQLGVGGSVSCSRSVNLPVDLASADYFLGAIADFSRRVAESDEGNNASDPNEIEITATGPTPTPAPVCPQRSLPSGTNVSDQGDTLGQTNDLGGSACGDGGDFGADIAYGYTAPANGVYTIDTVGSAFDTLIAVRGEACSGIELGCSDDAPGIGTQSRLTLALQEGQRIVIVVDGFGNAAGFFRLNVRLESPPVATSTPVERVVTPTPSGPAVLIGSASGVPGSTASFDVSLAAGGEDIAGAQNDIVFAADVSIAADGQNPDCTANPAIDKNGTQFAFRPPGCVPGVSCTGVRAIVVAFDNVDPIPNGSVLYTCNAQIRAGANGGARSLGCVNAGASRPDGSSIEPACFAGQINVVGAPTATPTPTQPPTGPIIEIGDATASRGQQVGVNVSLHTAGRLISGIQNDLFFDSDVRVRAKVGGQPDCQVNPGIGKQGFFSFQPPGCTPGASCSAVRTIVLSLENSDPIADASLLYTCTVEVGAAASLGAHPLPCSNDLASDPDGNSIATDCPAGSVDVVSGSGPTPTPTPTPTPNLGPAVVIVPASGAAGGETTLEVVLLAGGREIAGVQNDVGFDLDTPIAGRVNGRPDCTVNPDIDKNATTFLFQPSGCIPEANCTGMRVLVLSFSSVDPIPNLSTLYTCRLLLAADASVGPHPLTCTGSDASDPDGNSIELGCIGSVVDVTSGGGGSGR
jgi:hypothetical protein